MDFATILFFILFEILIVLSSIRLFYLVVARETKTNIPIEKSIIGFLSFSMILTIGIASIFSFTSLNDFPQYILLASILTIVLHVIKKSNLPDFLDYLKQIVNTVSKNIFDWKIIVIFIGLIPMLWWGLVPPDGTDSLYNLNWIFLWMTNQSTPYYNYFNYLPFNQLSYVPSMIITNSDNYFWMSMITPIILLGLVTYSIGKEFKLNKHLIWLSVFSSLLFFRLWMSWGPPFGSVKEDAIMGVGLLLIVLSILNSKKENLTRFTFIVFLFGIVFVSAKWAGLSVVVVGSIIFVLLNYKEISKYKRKFYGWTIIIFCVFIVLIGHVYLQSILEYGNPFYPMKITIFGTVLDGTRDFSELSSTSIIANIDDVRVQQILFPTDRISPGGLLFPIVLLFGTFGCIILIAYNIFDYVRRRKYDPIVLFVSIIILFSWGMYFNSVLTVCDAHDLECEKIVHIIDLHSMRYQFGAIFLTELFLIFILLKLRIPNWIVFGIIGMNLISRLWIDYGRMKYIFNNLIELEWIVFPILISVSLFFIIKYLNNLGRIIVVGSLILAIFIFVPQVVDDLRIHQTTLWNNIKNTLHELPPSNIFLIDKYNNAVLFPATYIIYGDKFQHEVKTGSYVELVNYLENNKNNVIDYPEYVAFLCHKNYQECQNDKEKLSDELVKYGFIKKANAKSGILFQKK